MAVESVQLASRLGYAFRDPDLLVRALTHSSWATEHPVPADGAVHHNELLEFLGDSVLGFIVSDELIRRYPDTSEGMLTKWRARLVRAEHLHRTALALELGEHLVLGRGEEASGGRKKKALLANAVEAVIAALYLDGGIEPARAFVNRFIIADFTPGTMEDDEVDYKSALQEFAFARKMPPPRYTLLRDRGPGHAKTFTVEVRLDQNWVEEAEGSSKKAASQLAARKLYERVRNEPESAD